jgi:hypothetical protein
MSEVATPVHQWLQNFWLTRSGQEEEILGRVPAPNPHLD